MHPFHSIVLNFEHLNCLGFRNSALGFTMGLLHCVFEGGGRTDVLATPGPSLEPLNPLPFVFFYLVSSTGHCAPFSTFLATPPIRYFAIPDWPSDAMTIRSTPLSFASCSIAS